MTVTDELLQKVASGQEVLLTEVRRLRESHNQLSEEFKTHRRDDREDFNRVFSVMETNRKDRSDQFGRVIETLIRRMDNQDGRIDALAKQIGTSERTIDRGTGAVWAILGFVGFAASIIIVVINHFWK